MGCCAYSEFTYARDLSFCLFAPSNASTLRSGDSRLEGAERDTKVQTLQMLADQFKANYERIRTWKGTCNVNIEERLSEKFVADNFHESVKHATPLLKRSNFAVRFVVDFSSDSIFRSKITSSTKFIIEETNKELKVSGITPQDETTILTPEHYVHMSPKQIWPGFGVLPDFPQARNKRAAFRDATREARGLNYGDLTDPRDFLGFSNRKPTFGQLLEGYMKRLKQDPSDNVRVYERTNTTGPDYRVVARTQMDGKLFYYVSEWSSLVGYSPVSMVFSAKDTGEGALYDMYVSWAAVEGIFVPEQVRQSRYGPDGKASYHRDVKITKQLLNQPIDEHQFDYQGLGLQEGEMIVDRIENAVYLMKDGAPTRLADFGTPYRPPAYWLRRGAFVVLVVAVVWLSAVIVRKRTAMKSRGA